MIFKFNTYSLIYHTYNVYFYKLKIYHTIRDYHLTVQSHIKYKHLTQSEIKFTTLNVK